MRRVGLRERAADGVAGSRGPDDRAEILRSARASRALEGLERRSDVVEPGQRKAAVTDQEAGRFGRLGEKAGDGAFLERRCQRQNRRPSGRRSCQGRYEPKNDAELERLPIGAASVCGN